MGIWYLGTGAASIMGVTLSHTAYSSTRTIASSHGNYAFDIRANHDRRGHLYRPPPSRSPNDLRLTHAEKVLTIEWLRENRTGIRSKHFKWSQFVEVFRDSQTHLIAVVVTAMDVSNMVVSSLTSLIMGFTTKETELLNVLNGVVSIISILTVTYLASHYNQRCLCVALALLGGLLGSCLLAFSHKEMKAAQLACNYLTQCTGSALPFMYSIARANVAGHTKKSP